MARKKKARNSPAGRAHELAAGISLLTVALLLFTAWPLMLPDRPIQVASVGFALAGLLATGATWSWALRVERAQNAAGKRLAELQSLSPDAFEEWVGARFREQGYAVEVAGAQGDHGIDLVVSRAGERAVVQCKNYRGWSVGEPVLRDLFGAMHAVGADEAYLVTTGRLTGPARAWVEDKAIKVWDGERLAQLSMQEVVKPGTRGDQDAVVTAPASGTTPELEVAFHKPPHLDPVAGARVNCPKCASGLVERRNRRTGEVFLGCSCYPACRHTQPLPA
jgi:restriction system protein